MMCWNFLRSVSTFGRSGASSFSSMPLRSASGWMSPSSPWQASRRVTAARPQVDAPRLDLGHFQQAVDHVEQAARRGRMLSR